MELIICLDDKKGMLFAKRRQSRDAVLNERVLEIASGKKLFMSAYSAKLFGENSAITVDDSFLTVAQAGDVCFAECAVNSLENVEKLYVFLWNRHYPADVFFKLDIEKEGFSLAEEEEFAGNAHDKITLKVYTR